MKPLSWVVPLSVLLVASSCTIQKRNDNLPSVSSTYVCTGETTRYPVIKVSATDSLLAVTKEEVEAVRQHYPGYRITGISGGLNASIGSQYDLFYLYRYAFEDVVLAFDLTKYDEEAAKTTRRMSSQEAREIVKYLVQSGLLQINIPEEMKKTVSSWPIESGGTLDVYTPKRPHHKGYEWEFGDWVRRLYSFHKES